MAAISYLTAVGVPPLPSTMDFRNWYYKLLFYRLTQCPKTRTTTYYVASATDSPAGSDSNAGTLAAPWLTMAKVNTTIAASSGDVAILFKRGSVWLYDSVNNPGITIGKDNVTIGAYSSGAKPRFSMFTQDYNASGWTQDGVYTNCWYRTVTNANWTAWVRTYGEVKTAITPFHRFTTLALLDADNTVKGFFYDSGNTKLYVNTTIVAADPDTLHLEAAVALSTPLSAVTIQGSGARVDNIKAEGWGIPRTWAGSSNYPIFQYSDSSLSAVISDCDVFYSAWHCIGMAGVGGNGGASHTVVNCDVGLFIDTGGTALVNYQSDGDNEGIFHDNIIRYGALPVGTSWQPRGYGYYGHTSGGSYKIALHIMWGNTYMDGSYGVSSDGAVENMLIVTQLAEARVFIFNNSYTNSNQYYTNNWGMINQPDAVVANNTISITMPVGTGGRAAFTRNATEPVWLWNNEITFDNRNGTSGGWGGPFYSTLIQYYYAIHNSITIRAGGQITTVNVQTDSAKLIQMRYANNIFLGDKSGAAALWLCATPGNDPLLLHHNAYSSDYLSTTTVTGYGIDPSPTLLNEPLISSVEPVNTSILYEVGDPLPFGINLEYDKNWNIRNTSSPSLGQLQIYEETIVNIETVNKATIGTDIWDVIRGYLNITAITNAAKIVSAYAKSYIKDNSNKDFVVIHKPEISEDTLTMTKKSYPFTILIEIVVSEEEQMKVISDLIRATIESNRESARGSAVFNLKIVKDDTSYETRENVRILHNLLTLQGVYRGAA